MVPLNTRPWANITNVPDANPFSGAAIEKTPSELAAHDATVGEHTGVGTALEDGHGLALGVKTPAYVPTTLVVPGYWGPPLMPKAAVTAKKSTAATPAKFWATFFTPALYKS